MTARADEMHPEGAERKAERERRLSALATRQHGVVATRQLAALGFTARAVGRRVESGRLARLYRGVYAVGHRDLSRKGRWMAAVLACGSDAALSHRTAAHARGFLSRSPRTVELVTPGQVRRRRGIQARSDSSLTAADVGTVDSIPCLSVPRTLLTLASVSPDELDGAVAQAERLRVLRWDAVEELLERVSGRPGTAALRAALTALQLEASWTRTELERRFLALCRDASLPRPRVNAWISVPGDGFEVDFSWPDHRLIVETDGRAAHGDRAAFESDRRRDQQLVAAGWRVVRFTWRQVAREPRAVAEILRRLLGEIALPRGGAR